MMQSNPLRKGSCITYMRVMLYGEVAECQQAMEILQGCPLTAAEPCRIQYTGSRDVFREQLVAWDPQLVVILADRSNGMEGVYTARETRPDTPVFWFYDDVGFGMQSHRLECDYFAVKPVTAEKLKKAFRRCRHIGIQIAGR